MTSKVDFQITSAHAGDNYIVVGDPSMDLLNRYEFGCDGTSLIALAGTMDELIQGVTHPDHPIWHHPQTTGTHASTTPILTVWRTLNVECDVMDYLDMQTSTPIDGIPVSHALLTAASEELARACIVINDLTPPEDTNTNPNPAIKRQDGTWAWIDPEDVDVGRDVLFKETNTSAFWSVRIVSVPVYYDQASNPLGAAKFRKGDNQIVIYYENVKNFSLNNNIDIDVILKYFLLHEIGHALGIEERIKGVFFESGAASNAMHGTMDPIETINGVDYYGVDWVTGERPITDDMISCMDYVFQFNRNDVPLGFPDGQRVAVPAESIIRLDSGYVESDLLEMQEFGGVCGGTLNDNNGEESGI